MIGCEVLPSAIGIMTRTPTVIKVIYDSKASTYGEITSLLLPEVKKVREKQLYHDLSPKETHAAIKTHFDIVKEECGVLDSKEVEVEIRTSYCPTMTILDLPGTVSGSTDTAVDTKSSGITGKYFRKKEEQSIILCESSVGDTSGIGTAIKLVKKEQASTRTVVVLTKIDKVSLVQAIVVIYLVPFSYRFCFLTIVDILFSYYYYFASLFLDHGC